MPRSLAKLSVTELQAEIRRRQRSVGTLERRREKLASKLAALNSEIAKLGGSAGSKGGMWRRPRNEMTLTDALAKVLSNKTMSVTDAAEAVKKIGYQTNSNNFRTQVNIALIKSGSFKRVGRGQYTAK